MFTGRKLVIATKHQKEKTLAPLLEKELEVNCFIPADLDTDLLGTFSGEIERLDDPVITLRKKCELAMEITGCDLALASEGSFGPHPAVVFVNADDEMIMLVDKQNDLEIIVREISTQTNFNGKEIQSERELMDFATSSKFPSHALIIRPAEKSKEEIVKGIINKDILLETFREFMKKYGKAYVETDMRAMFNPLRMDVIQKAAEKLITKVKSLCPKCKTPGFSVTNSKNGLPCSLCGFPTHSVLSLLSECRKCNYILEEKYPNNKTQEDPMFCDICNP